MEYELGVFFRRLRTLGATIARQVHPGLEPGGYALLVRLDEVGEARSSDLACYFNIGKPTASRQLRSLEDLGLIAREPDPADGRAQLLRLTAEGRERLERVRDGRQAQMRRLLGAWGADEVRTLARMLGRLNSLSEELAAASPSAHRGPAPEIPGSREARQP
ncbi:MarR family winged helix-turn-helix transcriptional regulator [Phaeacidiphilus oryzae]|uniref:MarR family winged helix-turn-helix transcriptional regulator n=1 Tax=Phaeacidiphilus oryzae TaxID=348818 RepID=UPI002AFDE38D|nr:MarR family transcriptional regulator [Phaeacidiphilus oryzae]